MRDMRNMYYTLAVDEERLMRQIIGPRVPLSWIDDLDNEALDYADDIDEWVRSDLISGGDAAVVDDRYMQVALAAVMMGDKNAVYMAEQSHRRLLLAGGGFTSRGIATSWQTLPPWSNYWRCVH